MSENERVYTVKTEETTPEINEQLINEIAEASGDKKNELAWKLAQLNYPLVVHMIKTHFSSFKDRDCLLSDGILALHDACKNINTNTPNKMFTTYACRYIYGYIMKGLKSRDCVVKRTKFNGVETKAEEISIDSYGTDIEDTSIKSTESRILSLSDGEFCKDFLKDVKDYYIERKTGHYSTFFEGKTEDILDALMTLESQTDMVEKCGVSKQMIDQVKQSMYIYTLQAIRDCEQKDREELFDIIYGGKYSVDSPPPLKGWRKEFWDMVFDTDEYKSHTYFKKKAKELRK
jgi:hypothetical protein